MSRSLDPGMRKLPYFSGIDHKRHQNHGSISVNLNKAQIYIYPKRVISRFTERFLIEAQDLMYNKRLVMVGSMQNKIALFSHDFKIRNFLVTKDPLK